MPTPVYLFTGFLDSGKTSLLMDTLSDPQFMESDPRTLILCFEQGETEYTEEWLDEHKAFIEFFDSSLELTPQKMRELDTVYHPNQVFIEFNGSEKIPDSLLKDMPDFWPLVEILSTIDATTFQLYIQNMRGMLFEQLRTVMWSSSTAAPVTCRQEPCAAPSRQSTGSVRSTTKETSENRSNSRKANFHTI